MTVENNNQHISNEKRHLLINLVTDQDYSIKAAAERLEIKYSTAKSILKVFRDENRIIKLKMPGKPVSTLTDDIKDKIELYIARNTQVTLRQIKTQLENEIQNGFTISLSSIRNALKQLKISCKQIHRELDRVNDPVRIETRRDYAIWYSSIVADLKNNIIFIDESSFNLHIRRSVGWSPIGQRANVVIPTIRGRSISLIAAISKSQFVYHEVISESTVNAQIFDNFFRNLCAHVKDNLKLTNVWFVFDNARVHKEVLTRQNCIENGFNYKFLSPYSYMLNPIENAFSKVKGVVKEYLSTNNDLTLRQMIDLGITSTTENDCAEYFAYVLRNIGTCAA